MLTSLCAYSRYEYIIFPSSIRTEFGVVGYKTTCFDQLQVSSTPGLSTGDR